jgi:hypothetical protein
MNPMNPKIAHAIKEIEAAYAGHDSCHAYYDSKLKVYVLVVSGKEAEAYHSAVMAIHDLATNAKRSGSKRKNKEDFKDEDEEDLRPVD